MNAQIREAAAQWLVEFRTDTPGVSARRQFAIWLRTSPQHISAYLDALALWEDAHGYDQKHRFEITTLVAAARADRTISDLRAGDPLNDSSDTPVADSPALPGGSAREPILRRPLRPHIAVAALLSLLINGAVAWFAVDWHSVGYTTQIAEQRSVRLADGTQIYLDGFSNIRVNFTPHERDVELLSGQVLFHVTKDPRRPFVVHVNGARIRDVGTEFNVNKTSMGTLVTVLEGRIAVLARPAPTKNLFGVFSSAEEIRPDANGIGVDAGQQTTIVGTTIAPPQTVDTAVTIAWMRRVLVFASTPLPEVAEEFNRFNSRQLVIASRALASFSVTGTFYAFDPESLSDFVAFLRKQPGIEVLEKGDRITVQTQSAQ